MVQAAFAQVQLTARQAGWPTNLGCGLAYAATFGLAAQRRNSPYRNRTVEENLDLFAKMAKEYTFVLVVWKCCLQCICAHSDYEQLDYCGSGENSSTEGSIYITKN